MFEPLGEDGMWAETAILQASNGMPDDRFGFNVAVSAGDTVAVASTVAGIVGEVYI
jgi:hypothetical protein